MLHKIAQLNQDPTEMRRQLDTYQERYKGVVKEKVGLNPKEMFPLNFFTKVNG
jgi:hypothetical protein